MSNIRTSYIRIFKRDGKDMEEEEIERLFKLAVIAYHRFGSYWVRIQKKYRVAEKCLDIQFGSGKMYADDPLECYEVFKKYYVWERVADEGGYNDLIFTLMDNGEWIDKSNSNACLYQFNKVSIKTKTLSSYYMKYHPIKIGQDEFELNMEGKYYSCNSRAFFKVTEDNPKCNGPCLQYDDKYETDFDALCEDGEITKSEMQFITDIFVYPNEALKMHDKVVLLWNDRIVQSVERIENDVISRSADYWDNCCDLNYLAFKEKYSESKQ